MDQCSCLYIFFYTINLHVASSATRTMRFEICMDQKKITPSASRKGYTGPDDDNSSSIFIALITPSPFLSLSKDGECWGGAQASS